MKRVRLEGSERGEVAVRQTRAINPEEFASVVVELRRGNPESCDTDCILTPAQFERQCGASGEDIDLVTQIAADFNLRVESASVRTRQVVLGGRLGDVVAMFGSNVQEAQLKKVQEGKVESEWFRYRTGYLEIPEPLEGIVLSVSGIDTRPQVEPRLLDKFERTAQFMLPVHIADFHEFREGKTSQGAGATIAILLFDSGYDENDVNVSRQLQGILDKAVIESYTVGGFQPSMRDSKDHREAALDIQVCSAIAPKAKLRLYFASKETSSVLRALGEAVHADPPPTVITMSWGSPEVTWSDQLRDAFERLLEDAEHLGISFFAASGDNGPGKDQISPDFPASSPRVTACGGLAVISNCCLGLIPVAWSVIGRGMASGGGFSQFFSRPSYQDHLGSQHVSRGIPDVAGYAALSPGYLVVFEGKAICEGATSAVAPLYAAFAARIAGDNLLPKFNHLVYSLGPEAFLDIIEGRTDLGRGAAGFVASKGWDLSTGLGSLIGRVAVEKLKPFRVPRPVDTPPPANDQA